LDGGGTIGYYEIVGLVRKLKYLVLIRKVVDEDGSALITKERIEELGRKVHDGHAQYYFDGLKKGNLPYDPDQSFEWMKISNRRGNGKIGQEGMKEARTHLRRERIRVAIGLRDEVEEAAMAKSEYRIINERLAKLLDYMECKKIRFSAIGRTETLMMELSDRV
jgi:hypothetical protein